MSQHSLRDFAPGIVLRLRIVFIAISIALACVTLVTFAQMRYLSTSIEELTETSISAFVRAENTERSLKGLLLMLQRADGTRNLDDFFALSEQAEEQLELLQIQTFEMAHANVRAGAVIGMQNALKDVDLGTRTILGLQSAIIEHEAAISALMLTLEQDGKTARTYFEKMSHDAALKSQNTAEGAVINSPKKFETFIQNYNESLALASTVTAISLEFEAVIDIATGLQGISSMRGLSSQVDNLRYRTRSIAVLTGQLSDTPERADLARLLLDVRVLLFGEAGILSEFNQLQILNVARSNAKQAQFAPIDRISRLSAEMLESARADIDLSRLRLEKATRNVIKILGAVLVVMLLAIAVTMIWIVERQINKRMARLTKAVLAIADGETSHRVNVSGSDELGKMANALKVFKSNAEELKRSNAELEKFAYVAAHDLRSPLRAIQDLSCWLLEDQDNVFSGEGQQYMTLMAGRIERLNQLLTDLLEYSRAGSLGLEYSDISMSTLVQETAEMLDPRKAFEIEFVGNSIDVVTYATPLRQILLNLVNNAIKHHDAKSGKVKVSAWVNGDRLICSVQDDGAGIEPKYHGRIFGLFQTLKPRDEVEASGLGLAIIHKLLERLGGKIAVESDPAHARGATFTFDVPVRNTGTDHIKIAA